jgi:CDP-glucose 4,6-dehydratase
MQLEDFYKNKKIFLTGHTGFKGSWMSLMLSRFGAEVTGYSLAPEDIRGNLFNSLKDKGVKDSIIADIRDYNSLNEALSKANPDIIFHFAAQPLVRYSYDNPIYNYETNVLGTVNILEAARTLSNLKAFINITTDKCYENKEWHWPYRESDQLGGHDPYSASKACSEIVTNSYRKSFYFNSNIGLASARAGNVIGGGDFSKDRIIPDIVEAIKKNETTILRNPNAVRPWQHVLDVLKGYLLLGRNLYNDIQKYSDSFNISPIETKEVNVLQIVEKFISVIGKGDYKINQSDTNPHEAQMLKLDASKALKELSWMPKYNVDNSVEKTALWYKDYLSGKKVDELCYDEIEKFMNL